MRFYININDNSSIKCILIFTNNSHVNCRKLISAKRFLRWKMPYTITVHDKYEPVKTDAPFKALNDWNDHLNRLAELDSLFPKKYPPLHRSMSPARELYVPKPRPRSIYDDPLRALGYNYAGQPIYTRPLPPKPLREMFEPNVRVPISRFVRDPWWWDYPELKPFEPPNHGGYKPSPFYLRNSYLSPVKRTYLWGHHPIRPFSQHYYS